MRLLESWIQTPAAAALGKTLLHSLWEGTAIAVVLALVLCCVRSSRTRYAAACLAMIGLLGTCAFTLLRVMPPSLPVANIVARIPAVPTSTQNANSSGGIASQDSAVYLPWLAPFWIAGVLIFQARAMSAWISAGRMRRTGVSPATDFWQTRLNSLSARLRASRPVALLGSCLAEVPVGVGYLGPVRR